MKQEVIMYEEANTKLSNCRLILAITSLLSGCAMTPQDLNAMTADQNKTRSYSGYVTERSADDFGINQSGQLAQH